MYENHLKGEVGELRVKQDLLERGFLVLEPLQQNSPYDVVAHDGDNKWWKIQVKFVTEKNGAICAKFTRRKVHKKNNNRPNEMFDVGAFYCPSTNECYYFLREEIPDCTQMRLRLSSEKDFDSIRWARNYKKFPPN